VVFEYQCTEALLNSTGLDKDVLQHRNWNQQLCENLKVAEHLGGKDVGENIVADRISEEFCRSSAKWALSICIGMHLGGTLQ
jgi:hypothetical protein